MYSCSNAPSGKPWKPQCDKKVCLTETVAHNLIQPLKFCSVLLTWTVHIQLFSNSRNEAQLRATKSRWGNLQSNLSNKTQTKAWCVAFLSEGKHTRNCQTMSQFYLGTHTMTITEMMGITNWPWLTLNPLTSTTLGFLVTAGKRWMQNIRQRDLGLSNTLCIWIKDFLSARRQSDWVHTSPPVSLSALAHHKVASWARCFTPCTHMTASPPTPQIL